MPSKVTLKALDYGSEATRLGFNVAQMTAANFDATLTDISTLQGAIQNVSLGLHDGKSVLAQDIPVGPKATVVNAQRESKWRVKYEDDTDPIGDGSFEIGMADLQFLVAGTGIMDVSAGAGAALVTAIEATVVSRLGNSVTVDEITHVGRNT
jgi:hypothetical protein